MQLNQIDSLFAKTMLVSLPNPGLVRRISVDTIVLPTLKQIIQQCEYDNTTTSRKLFSNSMKLIRIIKHNEEMYNEYKGKMVQSEFDDQVRIVQFRKFKRMAEDKIKDRNQREDFIRKIQLAKKEKYSTNQQEQSKCNDENNMNAMNQKIYIQINSARLPKENHKAKEKVRQKQQHKDYKRQDFKPQNKRHTPKRMKIEQHITNFKELTRPQYRLQKKYQHHSKLIQQPIVTKVKKNLKKEAFRPTEQIGQQRQYRPQKGNITANTRYRVAENRNKIPQLSNRITEVIIKPGDRERLLNEFEGNSRATTVDVGVLTQAEESSHSYHNASKRFKSPFNNSNCRLQEAYLQEQQFYSEQQQIQAQLQVLDEKLSASRLQRKMASELNQDKSCDHERHSPKKVKLTLTPKSKSKPKSKSVSQHKYQYQPLDATQAGKNKFNKQSPLSTKANRKKRMPLLTNQIASLLS